MGSLVATFSPPSPHLWISRLPGVKFDPILNLLTQVLKHPRPTQLPNAYSPRSEEAVSTLGSLTASGPPIIMFAPIVHLIQLLRENDT